MINEPSKGIGVEDIKHPSPDELELIPNMYAHNNTLHHYKSRGWVEHPECVAIEGHAPGFYKLIYLDAAWQLLKMEGK